MKWVLLLAAALAALAVSDTEAGGNHDPRGAIHAAAQAHGVDAAPLLALAACESRYVPTARGDRGRSHGLFQLNDQPTGLLHHYRALGYADPYDAEASADYVARVASGEFARQGVTLGRWTCHP